LSHPIILALFKIATSLIPAKRLLPLYPSGISGSRKRGSKGGLECHPRAGLTIHYPVEKQGITITMSTTQRIMERLNYALQEALHVREMWRPEAVKKSPLL
jgi:hypothetical protein